MDGKSCPSKYVYYSSYVGNNGLSLRNTSGYHIRSNGTFIYQGYGNLFEAFSKSKDRSSQSRSYLFCERACCCLLKIGADFIEFHYKTLIFDYCRNTNDQLISWDIFSGGFSCFLFYNLYVVSILLSISKISYSSLVGFIKCSSFSLYSMYSFLTN